MLNAFNNHTIRVIRWSTWAISLIFGVWLVAIINSGTTLRPYKIYALIGVVIFSGLSLLFSQEDRKRKMRLQSNVSGDVELRMFAMKLEPKRAAMAAFMMGLCVMFIVVVLATRVGGEMFIVLSSILIFVMAVLLIVWGITQFRRNRAEKDSAPR